MTEQEIIRMIQSAAPVKTPSPVRVPIGDDCAVIEPPPVDSELLLTTDQLIENQHFRANSHPADLLGGKLLARGVSDIAAMGGRPAWFLTCLACPEWADGEWLKHFFSGMFDKSRALRLGNCPLAGGDLSAAGEFSATITVAGLAPRGRTLLRSGAKPGDRVWVSGSLGGSTLGLERLQSGTPRSDPAVRRHLDPTPRVELGPSLLEAGATAAMDVSDGLSLDMSRIAEASGVGFEIDADAVPRFPGATLEQALHGGEEYELLFTARTDFRPEAETGGVPLTPIGEVTAEAGLRLRRDGRVEELPIRGFDHFR